MVFPYLKLIFGVAGVVIAYALMQQRRAVKAVGHCNEGPRTSFFNAVGDNCTICLFAMENAADTTYLTCGHSFHDACFNKLKQHSKVCPVCRTEI